MESKSIDDWTHRRFTSWPSRAGKLPRADNRSFYTRECSASSLLILLPRVKGNAIPPYPDG